MILRLQLFVMFSGEENCISAFFEWCAQSCTTFHPVRWSAHARAGGGRNYLNVLGSACRSAFQNFPARYTMLGFLHDAWTLKGDLTEHYGA